MTSDSKFFDSPPSTVVPTAKVWTDLRDAFEEHVKDQVEPDGLAAAEAALSVARGFGASRNYVIHEMADGGDWGFVTLGEECVHEGHMDSVINYVTEQLGIPWRRILGMGDRGWRSPKTNTAELMALEEQ